MNGITIKSDSLIIIIAICIVCAMLSVVFTSITYNETASEICLKNNYTHHKAESGMYPFSKLEFVECYNLKHEVYKGKLVQHKENPMRYGVKENRNI